MATNYLGTKLRELRESKGLLLRQVAAQIEVDTALVSKLERGERKAHRNHLKKIASALETEEDDLIVLWLADKLNEVIENEPLANKALAVLKDKTTK